MSASPQPSGPVVAVESGLDVVLLLLYAPGRKDHPGEGVQGVTRLQKMLFLLWKEGGFKRNVPELYNFKAYDLGPCMDDLYDDLEFAEEVGLIETREVPVHGMMEDADERSFVKDFGLVMPKRNMRKDFTLTDKGRAEAARLSETLSTDEQEQLRNVKHRYNHMDLLSLLRYVYGKYPEFAERSKIAAWL